MKSSLKPALCALALVCALVLSLPAAAAAFGPIASLGAAGSGAGQIEGAEGIAVGPDGSTYVADFQNRRVEVFGPDGAFSFAFGQQVNPQDASDLCTALSGCLRGERSGDAGALDGPTGVAVTADGTVYVSEFENNRVSVFTAQGKFLYAFGKGVAAGGDVCTAASGCQPSFHGSDAGSLYNPEGLAVSPSGDVYVADTQNGRIDVFSAQGQFRFAFARSVGPGPADASVCDATSGCEKGAQSAASGAIAPVGVAVAPDGRVLVADSNRRVSVFSAAGAFLYAFGKGVDGASGERCTASCAEGLDTAVAGAIPNPHGIGISPSPLSGSDVFVADGVNSRVVEYTLDGQFVKALGAGVATGAASFETCTYATGCGSGLEGAAPGAIGSPTGLAVDCRGGVLVGEWSEGTPDSLVRVERFGEPGAPLPTSCPKPPATPPPPSPPAAPSAPSNRFKIGKPKLNPRKGTAVLPVTVPGPGRVVLGGNGLKPVVRSASRAGTVKLAVRLRGRALLRLAALNVATVRASVTFTPGGGAAATQSKKLTLRKLLQAA